MRKRQGIIGCILGAAVSLFTFVATAQEGQPVRVRGQITAVKGQTLDILTRDGETRQVELAQDAKILAVLPSSMDAIKEDSFVGVASKPGQTESDPQTALEVVIFPESLRGAGEGYYNWDLEPESKMTNGTVRDRENGDKGSILGLRYPQGGTKVVVPPNTPVVMLAPGDRDLLKPGNHVFISAAKKQSDNKFTAASIAVGKDGLKPPM